MALGAQKRVGSGIGGEISHTFDEDKNAPGLKSRFIANPLPQTAQVVRTAQYGCNCRGAGGNGGCGEFDIVEAGNSATEVSVCIRNLLI